MSLVWLLIGNGLNAQIKFQTPMGEIEYEKRSKRPIAGGLYLLKLNGNPLFSLKAVTKTPDGIFGMGSYLFYAPDKSYTITYEVTQNGSQFDITLTQKSEGFYEKSEGKINRKLLGEQLKTSRYDRVKTITCEQNEIMKILAMEFLYIHIPENLPMSQDVNSKLGLFSAVTNIEDYRYFRKNKYEGIPNIAVKTTFPKLYNSFESTVRFEKEKEGDISLHIESNSTLLLALRSKGALRFSFTEDQIVLTSVDEELIVFDPAKIKQFLNKPHPIKEKNQDVIYMMNVLYELLWDDIQKAFTAHPNQIKKIWFLKGKIEILENSKVVKTYESENAKAIKAKNKAEKDKKNRIEAVGRSKENHISRMQWLKAQPNKTPEYDVDGFGYISRSKYHGPDTTIWYGSVFKTTSSDTKYYKYGKAKHKDKSKQEHWIVHGKMKAVFQPKKRYKEPKKKTIHEGNYLYGFKHGYGKYQYFENGKLTTTTTGKWEVDYQHGDCTIEHHINKTISKGTMKYGYRQGTWRVKNLKNNMTHTITYDEYGLEKSKTAPVKTKTSSSKSKTTSKTTSKITSSNSSTKGKGSYADRKMVSNELDLNELQGQKLLYLVGQSKGTSIFLEKLIDSGTLPLEEKSSGKEGTLESKNMTFKFRPKSQDPHERLKYIRITRPANYKNGEKNPYELPMGLEWYMTKDILQNIPKPYDMLFEFSRSATNVYVAWLYSPYAYIAVHFKGPNNTISAIQITKKM